MAKKPYKIATKAAKKNTRNVQFKKEETAQREKEVTLTTSWIAHPEKFSLNVFGFSPVISLVLIYLSNYYSFRVA